MAFLAPLAIPLAVAGGVVGAMGAIQSSQAAASAAKYNAAVAEQNAAIQKRNASMAIQAGEQRVAMEGLKTKAKVGGIMATQGAQGVDVMSGSALDVRSSAADLGELDALTVRSNAVKEAYGYEVNAMNDKAQAALDRKQASASLASGWYGAAGSLLGAASSAGSQFAKWQATGGGGTIPSSGYEPYMDSSTEFEY